MSHTIIFMDVDGTLCDDTGRVPESAAMAIKAARKNGHLVYLCTGRSKSELNEEIMSIGFDGLIGAGGGYVESNGEVLSHLKFEKETMLDLIDFLDENGVAYYLESNDGLFSSKNCISTMNEIVFSDIDQASEDYQSLRSTLDVFCSYLTEKNDSIDYSTINKVSFINNQVPFEVVQEKFGTEFNVMRSTVPVFGKNSGEIVLKGIHKGVAIAQLLEHLNEEVSRTMAYGDAHNDIEMFELVNVGVAMGNASEDLKKIADDLTTAHNQDGIYQSFKKYQLI